MHKKVLVVGLDGATFDVILPVIGEGRMPNLQRLIESGASGPLQSIMPPVTGPAWLALATGLTPGQTGVYDFVVRTGKDGFKFRLVSSGDFRGQALWDYLGEYGVRVGILNYPCLYPPYEVNGFMVSAGLGSPDSGSFTFPKELEGEVLKLLGSECYLNLKSPRYQDLRLFMEDLTRVFENHVRTTEHLLTTREWDFFWVVLSETDWIQHMMWKYFDASLAGHDQEIGSQYAELFKQFWTHVDDAIGRFMSIVGDDTNIVVLSDHGFGPCNHTFRINVWLIREGYLTPTKMGWRGYLWRKRFRTKLGKIARILKLKRIFPSLVEWGQRATVSAMAIPVSSVDLKRSLAFDPAHIGSFAGIYLNHVAFNNPSDGDALRVELTERLQEFGIRNGLDIQVWQPEQLYGSRTAGSPDLIVRIDDGECFIDKAFEGELIETKVPDRVAFLNGTHRMNGILIATGPDFVHGEIKNAHLVDVPATLLSLFGIPIPADVSGRVLQEVLKQQESVTSQNSKPLRSDESGETSLTEAEEEVVVQRLRDLGYR